MGSDRNGDIVTSPVHIFQCEGKQYTCTTKARFLVETANGTSSYTLERGFSAAEIDACLEFYDCVVPIPGSRKKRLTMIDAGKRTVVGRTK